MHGQKNIKLNKYIFVCTIFKTEHIVHLRQECHNSKFDIFELLV